MNLISTHCCPHFLSHPSLLRGLIHLTTGATDGAGPYSGSEAADDAGPYSESSLVAHACLVCD